jgi:protein-S-isoprenylcysteine O-methyltransferase Ste14
VNLYLRAIVGVIVQTTVFAALLFVPAGTLSWRNGWIFLGVVFAASILSVVAIGIHDPDLLRERMKPPIQSMQPFTDKVVLIVFVLSFMAVIAFAGFDAFRLQLLPSPPSAISWLGLALFLFGWWICYRALRDNSFAAPVVKDQRERGQRVVDTGLYGIVRHPMYAGALPVIVGMPLWLQSYSATLFSIVPILLLAIRISLEERFLRNVLPDYNSYTERVRSRVIPHVW